MFVSTISLMGFLPEAKPTGLVEAMSVCTYVRTYMSFSVLKCLEAT